MMQKEGGVYTTPCIVNGLKLRFIFDTGASNVSISLSEAAFMIKNGYLDKADLHGSSYSQIANGDIVANTTINIKELEIGGIKLYNVEANVIHELSAPLLLGQSAIQKLGKIQMEGNELVIMNSDSPSSDKACTEARELVHKADKYYLDKLFNLSSDSYQKAYDLCPNALGCIGIYFLGQAYYSINNFQSAIKFLGKATNCEFENEFSEFNFWIYLNLGESFLETKEYNNSILNTEKALSYASDDESKSSCYFNLARIYFEMKEYDEAVKYQELNIELFLRKLSVTNIDIIQGKVKNKLLGERYWNLSSIYDRLKQQTKSDNYCIKSALCGYESAIDYCKKYGINY
jgi:clan AA aspartic protease (TIGR02281 family)